MNRIFDDARDKNVSCVVIYAGSDNKLYYDESHSKAVPASDCLNLFCKGVVAMKNSTLYKPTSCTTAGVITFPFSS